VALQIDIKIASISHHESIPLFVWMFPQLPPKWPRTKQRSSRLGERKFFNVVRAFGRLKLFATKSWGRFILGVQVMFYTPEILKQYNNLQQSPDIRSHSPLRK
jgi:hypothetical protein